MANAGNAALDDDSFVFALLPVLMVVSARTVVMTPPPLLLVLLLWLPLLLFVEVMVVIDMVSVGKGCCSVFANEKVVTAELGVPVVTDALNAVVLAGFEPGNGWVVRVVEREDDASEVGGTVIV